MAAWEARKIAELGQDGFNQYRQDTFTRGKVLHAWIEEYLEHREPPADPLRFTDPVTQRHIQSLAPVLPRIGTVAALESAVYHPDLQYCGKDYLYAFNFDVILKSQKLPQICTASA